MNNNNKMDNCPFYTWLWSVVFVLEYSRWNFILSKIADTKVTLLFESMTKYDYGFTPFKGG